MLILVRYLIVHVDYRIMLYSVLSTGWYACTSTGTCTCTSKYL